MVQTANMEVMGIKFAPLNTPFHRRLQTLVAGIWFYGSALGQFLSISIAIYLLLFSNYWIEMLLYLVWAFTVDKNTCERGGRRIEWIRKLVWWKYFRDYFPIRLETVPGLELDPKKNYLFCSFPHGMLSSGVFSVFCTGYGGFQEKFPHHTPHLLTLKQHFNVPFFREYIYSMGACSASVDSINYLLRYPGGGKAPLLIVGGIAEAYHCKPGSYTLVLKNRKGFIRLAMKSGCSIIPILCFGETDIFDQVSNPTGSRLRAFQDWMKKYAGVAPILPKGRGFLQYSYGWVPQRRPITCLVGHPVDVGQVDNPSENEVNLMHETFIKHLTDLFEEHKHKYIENAEDVNLVIT